MCELLGMSANVPTDIRFSFAGLAKRGGETGPHRDGWGVAFYEGKAARAFHDPQASAKSEIARFIRAYPIKSRTVLDHVRRANRGRVCLENTHPFIRELWGRTWTFAHNGQLRGVKQRPLDLFRPVGSTDSEYAFCWMLGRLRQTFADLPGVERLDREVAALSRDLARLGVFNMLLSDGRTLYAFCGKKLCWVTRRAPFGKATLIDEDMTVNFADETNPHDCVSLVATRPLTRDEIWRDIAPGSLLALRGGEVRRALA